MIVTENMETAGELIRGVLLVCRDPGLVSNSLGKLLRLAGLASTQELLGNHVGGAEVVRVELVGLKVI